VRTPASARLLCVLASSLVLVAGMAAPALAAKGGGGTSGKPGRTTTTVLTGAAAIRAAHDATCPLVVEATDCSSLTVNIVDAGNTGWAAQASPATATVTYNSYYAASQADWALVVAHEVGGHVDAWNEIVAAVGTTQAWTDYYDLDWFAASWAPARWSATTGTTRAFTSTDAKEAYLDCAGPVAHGYRANYLYLWGLTTTAQQQTFCQGADAVMTSALTSVRG
jgi:hypothetical protein